ncbi:hypothetical protein PCE1_003750 [Barthelona sp. PCE]
MDKHKRTASEVPALDENKGIPNKGFKSAHNPKEKTQSNNFSKYGGMKISQKKFDFSKAKNKFSKAEPVVEEPAIVEVVEPVVEEVQKEEPKEEAKPVEKVETKKTTLKKGGFTMKKSFNKSFSNPFKKAGSKTETPKDEEGEEKSEEKSGKSFSNPFLKNKKNKFSFKKSSEKKETKAKAKKVVNLAKVELKSGEEEEEKVFETVVQCFEFLDEIDADGQHIKEWIERGEGPARLLRDAEGSTRMVIRDEQSKKVLINSSLKAIKAMHKGKKILMRCIRTTSKGPKPVKYYLTGTDIAGLFEHME